MAIVTALPASVTRPAPSPTVREAAARLAELVEPALRDSIAAGRWGNAQAQLSAARWALIQCLEAPTPAERDLIESECEQRDHDAAAMDGERFDGLA